MLNFSFERIIFTLPAILIAITVHEFAHAYSAYLLGDPTAKQYGRLTLDPLAHIDIMGFLMLLFAGFGWAKPVPVNPYYFKRRKLGNFIVSIAGPLSNILLAILITVAFGLYLRSGDNYAIRLMLSYGIQINLVLAVFNLLPIPPLDGSKLLFAILPERYEYEYAQLEKYSYVILIALLFLGIVGRILSPIVGYLYSSLIRLMILIL